MSEALQVRGGVGGIRARLDDLQACAGLLRHCAAELGALALSLARMLATPQLQATVTSAPVSLAAVDASAAAALAGPHGLPSVAARLEAIGVALGLAAGGYRAADSAADAAVHQAELAAGVVVGRAIAPVLLPAVTGAAAGYVLAGRLRLLPGSGPGTGTGGPSGTGNCGPPGPLRLLADLAGTGGPSTEHAVAAVPGMVSGLPVPMVLGTPGVVAALASPVREVPALAGLVGLLGPVVPGLAEPGRVRVTMRPGREVRPPADLGDLTDRIAGCYPPDDQPAPTATIRVDLVSPEPGRRAWVVSIPGQQEMSLRGGTNPFDLAGDVHAMARQDTAARRSVLAAMEQAGISRGEPILLAGHSQGGMVAAGLASDPGVRARYDITHVVTVGSPIAGYPVPDDVQVLAVEHTDDVVPRLDGRANPDRHGWVTVERTLHAPGALADAVTAHDLDTYRGTMRLVDRSRDLSVQAFRAGLDPFLDRPGATGWAMEFVAQREPVPGQAP
ncbi:MAG TPA: hypothetical protein VFP72_17810 [Kineosporiaceae bacterium]|nr:hypothetical protein [Kineosporiaceae bacterium]